jgi:hypothetical protein
VSFYISVLAALSYFLSIIVERIRSPRRSRERPHPSKENIPLSPEQWCYEGESK